MKILSDLAAKIQNGMTLPEILRHQHHYHEYRRWSVFDILKEGKLKDFDQRDRAAIWHFVRGEMTTQPAGVGISDCAQRLARELAKENKVASIVLQAAAAWVGRYWLEEEAHHEIAFHALMEMTGIEPVSAEEIDAHRGAFPDDNFVRKMMLQTCVEVEVVVTYSSMAKQAPGLATPR